jgi:hypothetical protein
MAKADSQGLLEMAITPGNRFKESLQTVEPKLNLTETLKTEISNVLYSKNKQFKFITQKNDYHIL